MAVRRKIKIIDSRIQVGLTLKVLCCLACYLLLFFLLTLFTPLSTLVTGGETPRALLEAKQEINYVLSTVVVPLAFAFACMALHVALMLHKLAGPIFRFNRILDSMRLRDLRAYARVRTGDYFHDTSERFEIVLCNFSEDLGLLKTEAQAAVKELQESGHPNAAERCEAMLGIIDRYELRATTTCDPIPGEADAGEQTAAPEKPATR